LKKRERRKEYQFASPLLEDVVNVLASFSFALSSSSFGFL
jgi:hypothetical protein